MAAVRETTAEQYPSAVAEDEDMRGADGKKKKFKPLSAVRKLFGGKKRKKEESVVAVKAQSTTALHSSKYDDDDDEDDDDGGFKSHQQKPVGFVAGTRSLSEDSVFSPEPREAPIGSFPKSAVSEESLPKSAFQSELFSKLSKRRSQYSDDDRDDGLPRSPVPPVTTADVIMGAPLKPQGKKSSNRDSDQSLISVDSSENEEDKLFDTNWKSAVPSVRSSEKDRKGSTSDMDSLDFSSIQKTELLTSGAAKDRISVKPKSRRATSKSRKKRDTNSPQSLPSLNEESPTGQGESNNTALTSGKKYTKTSPGGNSPTGASASASRSPVKTGPAQVTTSPGFSSSSPTETPTSPTSKPSVTTSSLPGGGNKISGIPSDAKSADVSSKNAGAGSIGKPGPGGSDRSTPQTSGKVSPTGKSVEASSGAEIVSNSSRVASRFLQNDKNSGSGDDFLSSTSPAKSSTSTSEVYGGVSLKSRMSQFQAGSSKSQDEQQTGVNNKGTGLKASDPSAKFSPKSEDFRLKRQNRSKTLPGGTDNHEAGDSSVQNSPGLQRAKSHRVTGSPAQSETVVTSTISVDSQDKKSAATAATTTTSETSSVSSSSTVNKLGNRFAAFEKGSSTSTEPTWMNLVKKKKDEMEGTSSASSAGSRGGPSSSAPKTVFSSSSYLEKKRGSMDSSSSGGNSSSRGTTPRDAIKESGSSSSSSTSSAAPHLSQGKRESIEINLSELNSVKSSASKAIVSSSSPSSSTSPSSVFTSVASSSSTAVASTADRARLFSGPSQNSSSSPTKPVAGSQQDSASTNVPDTQVRAAGSGVSQFRGGSVKTSPTKSAPGGDSLKPWQSGRSSSVKVSPAFLAASPPVSTSASVSKPIGAASSSKNSNVNSSSKPPQSTSSTSTPSSSTTAPSTTASMSTNSSSSGRFAQSMSNNNNKNNNSNSNTNLPSSHSVLKSESSSNSATDKLNNRSSRVLDMVKNFQNLQVSS